MSICKPKPPESNPEACQCEVCPYKTQVRRRPYHYGDLYVLGRLWIETMKSVILGSKSTISEMDLVPKVCAAPPPKEEIFIPPSKPPMMRYSDLPLNSSPHVEYYEYEQSKTRCSGANRKLLHEILLPTVSEKRKEIQKTVNGFTKEIKDTYCEISSDFCQAFVDFKKYIRSSERDTIKPFVVAAGGATGYIVASKLKKGKLFYTAIGTLAGGFLAYPDETDEIFRNCCYHTSKVALEVYNKLTGANAGFSGGRKRTCTNEFTGTKEVYISQCVVDVKKK